MAESTGMLPRGFVARTGGVAIRPKLYWAFYAWFGVALCLLIAVVMPIDTARQVAAGKKGIEMGAVVGVAAAFGLLAIGMAVVAVRLSRSAWVIDAAGLRKQNWRAASVRWEHVSAIELKLNGRYWQVWVHAPGAVDVTSRRQSCDRLILPAKILAHTPMTSMPSWCSSGTSGRTGDRSPAMTTDGVPGLVSATFGFGDLQ